jgi:transposase
MPKGRPKKLNDKKIKALSKEGWSLKAIATSFGVTRGAIQAALKR